MVDPISDMLNRIRNAQAVNHPKVDIPSSNFKFNIAQIMERYGFIEKAEKKGKKNKKVIEISLKYKEGKPAIMGLKRISKPGQRIYLGSQKIKCSKGSYGIMIVSTSKGLMTSNEARKEKLGGELICEIW